MNHLFNLLCISLLLVNLTGLTVAGQRLMGLPYGVAKSFTVLTGCLLFFFVEHFVGLGQAGWLLLPSTCAAVWVIARKGGPLRGILGSELPFLAGFGYALLWRYFFPNIDASSEKLADLSFIAGYLSGSRLPAPDLWLHPYSLTQYYSFQHYGAALMGRILQIPCGTAYNLGYCVLVGLVLAPARNFIRAFTVSRSSQALILAVMLVGGTGACVFTPAMVKDESLFSSMRFVGGTNTDDDAHLKPLGIALRNAAYGAPPYDDARRDKNILEMPMEIFSYVVQLGDYHAPLGGYLMLTTALGAFGVLLQAASRKAKRWALVAVIATVPLCIVVNTWSFPLQGILVFAGLAFLWAYRERPEPLALGAGLLITCLLLYPCFSYFLPHTVGAAMKVQLVKPDQHPPIISYLLQMWPVLGLTVLAWFAAVKGHRQYRWFSLLLLGFLLLLEILNIDDLYGGRFERFNTTLKWWPWVAALSLLLLAPLNLADFHKRSVVRIGTGSILIALLFFLKILSREWVNGLVQRDAFANVLKGSGMKGVMQPNLAIGQLDGANWLRIADTDPAVSANQGVTSSVLSYLQARPGGVCLEAPIEERMGFVETGAIPLFSGHPTVFGWASHEQLWRGYQQDIEQRWNRTREFFAGNAERPLDFLEAEQVKYILWPVSKPVDQALFKKISEQIGSRYVFIRFDEGDVMKGIWERRAGM